MNEHWGTWGNGLRIKLLYLTGGISEHCQIFGLQQTYRGLGSVSDTLLDLTITFVQQLPISATVADLNCPSTASSTFKFDDTEMIARLSAETGKLKGTSCFTSFIPPPVEIIYRGYKLSPCPFISNRKAIGGPQNQVIPVCSSSHIKS